MKLTCKIKSTPQVLYNTGSVENDSPLKVPQLLVCPQFTAIKTKTKLIKGHKNLKVHRTPALRTVKGLYIFQNLIKKRNHTNARTQTDTHTQPAQSTGKGSLQTGYVGTSMNNITK